MGHKYSKSTLTLCSRSDCTKTDCPNFARAQIKGKRFDYRSCMYHPDYIIKVKREQSYDES